MSTEPQLGEVLTVEDLKRLEEWRSGQKQCRCCFILLPKDHNWLVYEETGAELCSEECLEKFKKQIAEYGERMGEYEKMVEKIKHDHEHSIKPYITIITIIVRGLKKDIEAFQKDLPEIKKKYNLE